MKNAEVEPNHPHIFGNRENLRDISGSLKIRNNQSGISKLFLLLTMLAGATAILPFQDNNPLSGFWALAFVSIFLTIAFFVTFIIFRKRAMMLDSLIQNENVVARWKLSQEEKRQYAGNLFSREVAQNKSIRRIMMVLLIVIFGLFILFMDEGRLMMAGFLVAIISIISLFAWFMPRYYRFRNERGDGIILIGKKFAYINGFFHNWNFPLSGIKKVKPIDDPFRGILIEYYYTDRTLRHSETLIIPASDQTDVGMISSVLMSL
jgi:hypothetical protein